MCGIAGRVTPDAHEDFESLSRLVGRMRDALTHRGPDSEGLWVDPVAGVGLGHRRLAILDLTSQGHQPMVSACERYVLVFNGEIYNFRELRAELLAAGDSFRGTSDTEVLLAALNRWGLSRAVPRLSGMFAFALWDRKTRVLSLARDHVGKKPLYLGWAGRSFVFASELKAIRALPDAPRAVHRGALTLFMRHSYVPSPWSVYQGVYKLPPGTWLQLDFARPQALPHGDDLVGAMHRYWSVNEALRSGDDAPWDDDEAALDALDAILSQAVARRMVADVPLGAFLSGGIDSSLIVALMQKQSLRPVKTFTIGFAETGFDEARHARAVADYLGTDHTEITVTPDEARTIIPRLPEMFDEPFADMSQIPTWHVCALARQEVTVALSGDGGDESFGGYARYLWARSLYAKMRYVPGLLRALASMAVRAVPVAAYDALLSPCGVHVMGQAVNGHRVHVAARLLGAASADDLYRALMSHWKDPSHVVLEGFEPITPMTDPELAPAVAAFEDRMMAYDTLAYLPDDILVKVDRTSMDVSLEARAPLLDREVIAFAWTQPLPRRIRHGQGKWLLRALLDRYVPAALTHRPKQGFGVPMGVWLRGPLREWAEALLSEKSLARHGLLDAKAVRRLWCEHLAGTRDWDDCLWDALMAQAWAERWG